ncbi:MAG: hypothetical protein MZV64_35825 [Ignavibacteriales bacterium]|nr:hypothetical protein [Ignavibacteriales bacterium]
MVSFTASLEQNNVVLKWQTATELNSSYFSIERKVAAAANGLQSVVLMQQEIQQTLLSTDLLMKKSLDQNLFTD